MGWFRGIGVLLAAFAAAALIAWLTLRPEVQTLPTGSSRSYQPDGLQALYRWAEATGTRASRFDRAPTAPLTPPAPDAATTGPAGAWLAVQPARILTPEDRQRLDAVPQRGGTLIVAADSLLARPYLATLGFTLVPTPIRTTATVGSGAAAGASSSSSVTLPIAARNRIEGAATAGATPLLLDADGGWLALRKPYLNGTLIVFATPYPLTNEALRNPDVARFIYRELLARVPSGGTLTFDESLFAIPTATQPQRTTLRQLILGTAPGWAVLYAAGVVFLCLLLTGRRFGPALPPIEAGETPRTMEEHVQAVAGIYRRAGHFAAVRSHFVQHFRRAGLPPPLLSQVASAPSESTLLAAVSTAHRALQSAAAPALTPTS